MQPRYDPETGPAGVNERGFMVGKRLICIILWVGLLLVPVVASGIEAGKAAPDFKLKDLAGQEHSLSDFKGRAVLLKLATTWCPTCKQLSSQIEKIGTYLKEQDAVFLDVFVQDTPAMVSKSLKGRDFIVEFHALLDDGQVHRAYNVYLIPRLLIIDPQMRVFFDSAGRDVTGAKIKQLIEELKSASQDAPAGN
ncbi:MAG: redoxin domain-containing protein [Desulfuromonadales bacterium]|nr:redoxin domain-containing protein [Desulfuromonadales bacterium]